MGWQLIPTGIGRREFDKTLEEGWYECVDDRCEGRRDPQRADRYGRDRNRFTVLSIPIITLNVTGEFVRTRRCKRVLPTSVLADARSRPAPGEAVRPTWCSADPVPKQPVVSHFVPVPRPPAGPAPLAAVALLGSLTSVSGS